MLRTIRIWLLLFVIAGMPKLITIFGTTLVFIEEIENEEMTSPDRSIEEETVFDKPKTWKTPRLRLGNRRLEIQLVNRL